MLARRLSGRVAAAATAAAAAAAGSLRGQARLSQSVQTFKAAAPRRSYHSYPDPDEKPVITNAKSTTAKTVDKLGSHQIDKKFRLDVAFPGIPQSAGESTNAYPKTFTSRLSNGIQVASQDLPSLMSSFAVVIKSGSSSEDQTTGPESTFGATHAIELNAFHGTKNRTHEQVAKEIEMLGGIAQCISNRESILFCIDVLRENAAAALDILADAVVNAVYTEEDIEECKQVMIFQQKEFPGEVLSRDLVMLAGFRGSPLGNYHFIAEDDVSRINAKAIERFRSKFFVGDNIVISGAGIDHELFVQLLEEKFGRVLKNSSSSSGTLPIVPPSTYVGGMSKSERELKEPFIKIALGFKIGGWHDKYFVASCVLQQLLGGGSSFSAGGPGKGMYTRLYTQVLNQYHWVESAESFISVHDEVGVFGIDGSCMPEYAVSLLQVFLDHLVRLAVTPVTDEELDRAKNMLRSMMMMQLESRLVVCEDIARQMATYGKRELPAEVSKKIEAVTKEDLQAVARDMVQTFPVVGCVGSDLSNVPSYEEINESLSTVRSLFKK